MYENTFLNKYNELYIKANRTVDEIREMKDRIIKYILDKMKEDLIEIITIFEMHLVMTYLVGSPVDND